MTGIVLKGVEGGSEGMENDSGTGGMENEPRTGGMANVVQ